MTKLKTALLIILVIISIALSVSLMIGQRIPGRQLDHEKIYFSPKPEIGDVALPTRIQLISANGSVLQVKTFSSFYTELIIQLSQLQYGPYDEGEIWQPTVPPAPSSPGILFRYEYPVSKGLLASLLIHFHETDFPFDFDYVDAIFVTYDADAQSLTEQTDSEQEDSESEQEDSHPPKVYFINEQSRQAWSLSGGLAWEEFMEADDHSGDLLEVELEVMESGPEYSVSSRVYDASSPTPFLVPVLYREEIDYNAVVKAFYLDPSTTRLIQERDGAELYTDGFQALRIYPTGALEYTVAQPQPRALIPEQTDAVETALDFVTQHGGWIGDILLSENRVLLDGQVRLDFSGFGRGLPLYGENTGIVIEMDGLAINYYSRRLLFATEDNAEYIEVIPLSKLLETASTEASQTICSLQGEITDVSLGYYWLGNQIVIVWRVVAADEVYLIAASDGSILVKEGG